MDIQENSSIKRLEILRKIREQQLESCSASDGVVVVDPESFMELIGNPQVEESSAGKYTAELNLEEKDTPEQTSSLENESSVSLEDRPWSEEEKQYLKMSFGDLSVLVADGALVPPRIRRRLENWQDSRRNCSFGMASLWK
jgi:hypothetical protein